VVSVFKEPPVVDMRAVNFKELSLVGARVYTREDFDRAIEMAEALPLDPIVSHRLPITRVADAFGLIFDGERVSKVLLLPQGRDEPGGDFPDRRG
jgi:threonine dehydrogenase-like Zn-dependent dehydrogenase